MSITRRLTAASLIGVVVLFARVVAADQPPTTQGAFTRTEDVAYGRSFGTELTMDIYRPTAGANGRGVMLMVSGGWVSDKSMISPRFEQWFIRPLLRRGYTVFAVLHGCQPQYTIPEIVPMVRRAVRFVRYHAAEYNIDPDRLGVCGGSAGGHLSLMLAAEEVPGKPDAPDPVDRQSCRVAAAGAFFPPTDFLNYGETGAVNLGTGRLQAFRAPFDFREMSKRTHALERVTEARSLEIGHDISPIYHVSKSSAPTLLFHGDADNLVPIQQSQIYVAKMTDAGASAELVVKPGKGHGWGDIDADLTRIADWFDRWLISAPPTSQPAP